MYFEQRPDHDRRATFDFLGHVAVLAALFGVGACSASDPNDPSGENASPPSDQFSGSDMSQGGGGGFSDMGTQEPPFIPEIEEDFTFSQPAVVGREVFIANETLNSVAVIDSTSLAIRTLPVGFRPTAIVGPKRDASTEASRVVVLNEGSNSVSVIDPLTRATQILDVMDGANALTANPDSSAVVAWYDDALFEDGDPRGDLSSITLIQGDEVYQIAVGFHVRKVSWIEGSSRLLIVTDDGVSVIKTDEVIEDRVQVPVAVLPRELIPEDPRDLEVLVDVTGSFAVARVSSFSGVVVTSLDEQVHYVIDLPEIPTDIDMIGGDVPGVMVMLPRTEAAVVMSLPDGAINAAAVSVQIDEQNPDMGQSMGEDMPEDMAPPEDMGADDMDMMSEDMTAGDMAVEDMPQDMEAIDDMDEDMSSPEPDMAPEQSPLADFIGLEGVDVIELPAGFALGAAVVSEGGKQALIYTTLSHSKLGMLYAFERGESREVFFEKGIKAVIADKGGDTFLAFHSRDEDAGAGDVIASSWGLSVVDVSSATPRLVITAHEPWRATLWSVDGFAPRAYVIFKRPMDEALVLATQRDVLGVNLDTFSVNSFRVSSSPEGIGAIPAAGRVYVNQTHPQGRMTFVDVDSGEQQTVTGYQLNARID